MKKLLVLLVIFSGWQSFAVLGEIGIAIEGARQIGEVVGQVVESVEKYKVEIDLDRELPAMTINADINGALTQEELASTPFRLHSCNNFQIGFDFLARPVTLDFRFSWGYNSERNALVFTMNSFDPSLRWNGKKYASFVHVTKPIVADGGALYMAVTVEFVQTGQLTGKVMSRSITGHFFSDGRPVVFDETHHGRPENTTVGNCTSL